MIGKWGSGRTESVVRVGSDQPSICSELSRYSSMPTKSAANCGVAGVIRQACMPVQEPFNKVPNKNCSGHTVAGWALVL